MLTLVFSACVTAYAGRIPALSDVAVSEDAPLEKRSLKYVSTQLPEADRFSRDEIMAARMLLPDLIEHAPVGMWAFLQEETNGLPPGTPVLILVIEKGAAMYIASNGVRALSSASRLQVTPPDEESWPTFAPLTPDQVNATVVEPYAQRRDALSELHGLWVAERDRVKACRQAILDKRVGSDINPGDWNVTTFDRSGRITSVKRWSQVLGEEISATCRVAALEAADDALAARATELWNSDMQRVQEGLRARIAGKTLKTP